MKARLLAAAGLLVAAASSVQAQASSCPAGGGDPNTVSGARANVIRDACLQGSDIFALLAPQLGLALAGGNATPGQSGTLGGFPHFVVSVRGNLLAGDIPDFGNANYPAPRNQQNPESQVIPSKNQIVGMPVVDAAVGVFRGLPLGLTNVGGVDLLVSAAYVPRIGGTGDSFRMEPEKPLQLGFGARVGLLQESLLLPGVSFTFIQRSLPTTDIFGRSQPIDLDIENASVKTNAWRLVAGKNLLLFGVAGGIGQDIYDLGTTISGSTPDPILGPAGQRVEFGPISLKQKMTRSNMFLNASMNLMLVRIVGEIGRAAGGDLKEMVNTFSGGEANQPRVYGSLALRVGL